MKNFKAHKAYVVCMLVLSVFISSSLVFGASDEQVSDHKTPDAIVTTPLFAGFGDAGITNQGIYTVVSVDIGTAQASTLGTGFHNKGAVYPDTTSNIGKAHRTIRPAHPQCQDSCSL